MGQIEGIICLRTGNLMRRGDGIAPESSSNGVEHMWVPVVDGEPYFSAFFPQVRGDISERLKLLRRLAMLLNHDEEHDRGPLKVVLGESSIDTMRKWPGATIEEEK